MAQLVWGTVGQRRFETGADRGVLYVDGVGFAWNGLTSVKESISGGEPQPYYYDGVKYLNLASAEDYAATIEAFSSPEEFDQCDGTVAISNGLFATQQPRKEFDFSFRTLIGNDLDGTDYGYKIHLVYNALAAPADRDNVTISDSPNPATLSWPISTRPPVVSGHRPTAHFVIDSSKTPEDLMVELEDILYGTSTTAPRMPDADEVTSMFAAFAYIEMIAEIDNGASYETVLVRIHQATTPPVLPTGQQLLWLDTSSGASTGTLKLVTGD